MKFRYSLLLTFLLFPAFSTYAQYSTQNADEMKPPIEYQWPKNGDEFIPQKAVFIIRPAKAFMTGRLPSDFIFSVHGSVSGEHPGKVIILTDLQTINFKPDEPFAVNENVSVRLVFANAEKFSPLEYSFGTTTMTDDERGRALYQLQQKDLSEIEAFREAAANNTEATLPINNDTIAFNPADVIIDTLTDTATTNKEGNIFLSPTGKFPAPYSFIAIANDDTVQAAGGSNNFIFERDIADKNAQPDNTANFRMQPDGTLTYFRQSSSPTGGIMLGQTEHLDQHLHIIDTFQCVGYTSDFHEFQLLFNKRSILVAYDPQKRNMQQYLDTVSGGAYSSLAAKASDTATVFGAIIQVLDEHKNPFLTWRSWDHFQIVDATSDIDLTKNLIDYMHVNTAISDPDDQNIIASFRHCDEVSKININDGSFIWQWGGKHNQFAFLGDTLKFSHQHDPERITNGHIILFDNGNLHTVDTMLRGKDTIITLPSSRAVEYALDEKNHTATTVWEYTNLPFSGAAGNAQRFDDGNTLICLGITTQPSVIEVDPNSNRIFRMSIQTGAFSYRTYRFPFTPLDAVRKTGTAHSFGIAAIYPNPVKDQTTVDFSINNPGIMHIEVLDVLGHPVRNIEEKLLGAGTYSADLDLHNLPAGVYYCRLSQGGNTIMRMIAVEK